MTSHGADERADLCPYGCYWECEHRPAPASASGERGPRGMAGTAGAAGAGGLFAAEDTQGRPLQRCRDCGDFFYSATEHARDHEQLRQLGLIPDDPLPQPWAEPWGRVRPAP